LKANGIYTKIPTALLIAFAGIQISFASSSDADEFIEKAVSVIDGDTIEVLHDGKAERIRLYGIDTGMRC